MKSLSWMTFLVVYICSSSLAAASLDLESLPSLRKKQYQLTGDDKFIIYSPARTGSTLLFEFFRFLFEDIHSLNAYCYGLENPKKVVYKIHSCNEQELIEKASPGYLVVPIRDFPSSVVSMYKAVLNDNRHVTDYHSFIEDLFREYVSIYTTAEKLQNNGIKIIKLDYDLFSKDLDYIFDTLSKELKVDIDVNDKRILKDALSKENVQKQTANLPTFGEHLPLSGFHGFHISCDSPVPLELLYSIESFLQEHKDVLSSLTFLATP
jgi:hypothetical protein